MMKKNGIILLVIFAFTAVVFGKGFSEYILRIGDGFSDTDTYIYSNQTGNNDPYQKYDAATNKWVFSNDGLIEKNLGSGDGSGGGDGINEIENGGFEDGPNQSFSSSGGVVSELTIAPDLGLGEKSARFVSTIPGEYYESDLTNFSQVSQDGFGCAADFRYKQGGNFVVKIIGADGTTVIAEETITDQSVWAEFPTFYYPCEVSHKIRWESIAAGTIDLENIYLGSQKGFSTLEDQDVGSLRITADCGSIVSQENDFVVSVSKPSDRRCSMVLKSGEFTVPPAVVVTAEDGSADCSVTVSGVGTSGVNTLQGVGCNEPLHVVIRKQGVDTATKAKAFTPSQTNFYYEGVIHSESTTAIATSFDVPGTTLNATNASPNIQLTNQKGAAKIGCLNAASTGTTCSGVDEINGIDIDLPKAGTVEVCMSGGPTSLTSNSFYGIKLVKTDLVNNATIVNKSISQSVNASNSADAASEMINICETFDVSVGEHRFQTKTNRPASTGGGAWIVSPYLQDTASGTSAQYAPTVKWTVKYIEQFVARPIIQDMVSTPIKKGVDVLSCAMNSDESFRDESAEGDLTLCSSWITVISENQTGNRVFTVDSKYQVQRMSCSCSPMFGTSVFPGNDLDKTCSIFLPNNGAGNFFRVVTEDINSAAPTNIGVTVTCVHQKN